MVAFPEQFVSQVGQKVADDIAARCPAFRVMALIVNRLGQDVPAILADALRIRELTARLRTEPQEVVTPQLAGICASLEARAKGCLWDIAVCLCDSIPDKVADDADQGEG